MTLGDKKEKDLNLEFAVELKKVLSDMVEKGVIGVKEEEFLVKKEWVLRECLNFDLLSLDVAASWKGPRNLLITFSNQ